MKAVVYRKYGGPDVLELTEVEKPVPGDSEILIKIDTTTVTTESLAFRSGTPVISRLFTGLTTPKQPILGTEFTGQVEAIGKDVNRFKVGDPVFGDSGDYYGAYAEYTCLPEQAVIAVKPSNRVSAEAHCGGHLTAIPFLRDHAQAKKGQKILINGASGSVGSSAVQIAKHYGLEVTAVCSTANVELVKSLGADRVIDYKKQDFTKQGAQYDIVFDAVAKSSFSKCKRVLKQSGRYITTMPTPSIMLQMMWTSKFSSKKAIFAATGLRPSAERAKDLQLIKELYEKDVIKTVVDRRYPLAQMAEANRYVESGRKKGNVVIEVR